MIYDWSLISLFAIRYFETSQIPLKFPTFWIREKLMKETLKIYTNIYNPEITQDLKAYRDSHTYTYTNTETPTPTHTHT